MVNLLQFDRAGLGDFCEQLGEKRFRATQLFRWIHQRGERDPAAMTDLAKSLRDKLAGSAVIEALPVASEQVAADGTIKWLFDVGAGDAIETVFIPERIAARSASRRRPAAPSTAGSAPPATRASAATSAPPRSSPSSGMPSSSCAAASGSPPASAPSPTW